MISETGSCVMHRALSGTRLAKAQNAVTFIELFLVIIIIGVLAGISIPQFRKTFNNLQLKGFSQELQSFMNYLCQRSIVEGKIIYLNIDNENKKYSAQIKDAQTPFKTYSIPKDIKIELFKPEETDNTQILFKPDGEIEKVTIKLTTPDNQKVSLTTEGVFGKVKIKTEDEIKTEK